jgi:enterochelin esterase-like enzyme
MTRAVCLLVACCITTVSLAIEPEIKDGQVLFQLAAPQAKQVTVSGEWNSGKPEQLVCDDKGVWSVAVTLPPNIYSYTFRVDGVPVVDPRNPRVKSGRSLANYVEVPATPPAAYELQHVPHGAVATHTYTSKVNGAERSVVVYTPPTYYENADRKLPVLYLLHGSGDDERGWTDYGRAHLIADNLLAQKQIEPMLIVMPYGHMADYRHRTANTETSAADPFEADLLGDVIPLVESRYRVRTEAISRALMGLSMGGRQTFEIGLRHPDRFSALGVYSYGGPRDAKSETLERAVAEPASYNRQLKLFWIGCGRDDRAFAGAEQIDARLSAASVKHTMHRSDGGHNWQVWREYLRITLPLLFRQ